MSRCKICRRKGRTPSRSNRLDLPKRVNDGDANADRKKKEFFDKKTFAKGKKLKTRPFDRTSRSAFSPNTAARTVPDWRRIPCCASLATRRPRPQKVDVRGSESQTRRGERRRRRSKTNRPTGCRGRSNERERTSPTLSLLKEICQRGATGAPLFVRAGLGERRLGGNAIRDIFEFRGEFVLLDFVVHRFFANAEFSRGKSTATVASDERFEKSETFDLRQRQPGEAERRRGRNVGATGRAEGNGKRARRRDGRRKRNVGD